MKMARKTREDYRYYSVSIRNELRIFFEAYIRKYPNLGYKNVSSFITFLLQQKAEELVKDNPDLAKIEEITLPSGTYVLQEDGTYKRIE
ncbi:hypothetical protein LCGC14_2214600 [marine sediment metagenome]|uniref:Uncharacterized protein n=1 Tax=marine sediment metagenome TaxID=412755 RepID=A0A0F9G8D9_9ZZZZ